MIELIHGIGWLLLWVIGLFVIPMALAILIMLGIDEDEQVGMLAYVLFLILYVGATAIWLIKLN